MYIVQYNYPCVFGLLAQTKVLLSATETGDQHHPINHCGLGRTFLLT